ncbi:hypothetical protein J6590_099471 [Homalodisca vitripennis]|nr:hypothetical protein J6590_099471 [Homalodisca vitripennis]
MTVMGGAWSARASLFIRRLLVNPSLRSHGAKIRNRATLSYSLSWLTTGVGIGSEPAECRGQFTHSHIHDSVFLAKPTAMNELVAESCAVLCSTFSAILGERLKLHEQIRKRKKRRYWVRKWILKRSSEVQNLVEHELRGNHHEDFKNLLRMSEEQYDYLLERVTKHI